MTNPTATMLYFESSFKSNGKSSFSLGICFSLFLCQWAERCLGGGSQTTLNLTWHILKCVSTVVPKRVAFVFLQDTKGEMGGRLLAKLALAEGASQAHQAVELGEPKPLRLHWPSLLYLVRHLHEEKGKPHMRYGSHFQSSHFQTEGEGLLWCPVLPVLLCVRW